MTEATTKAVEADIPAALSFLRERPHQVHNLVAITEGKAPVGITRPKGHTDLEDFVRRYSEQGWNLYFSLNEPKEGAPDGKLKKEDVARIISTWVDIDPAGNVFATGRAESSRTIAALAGDREHAPSVIIDSGGGFWAIWDLVQPIPANKQSIEWAEAQSNGLANKVGADHCHNIDRIARLPGTVNHPNAQKREQGRSPAPARVADTSGKRYDASALETIAPPLKPRRTVSGNWQDIDIDWDFVFSTGFDLDDLPSGLARRLEIDRSFRPDLNRLLDGDIATVGKDHSRSGQLFALMGELRAAGYSATEASTISVLAPIAYTGEWQGSDEDKKNLARSWMNTPRRSPTEDFDPLPDEPPATLPSGASKGGALFYEWARDIKPDLNRLWLVDMWLGQGALSVMYGQSNVGKTFAAMAISYAVATGTPWAGRETIRGVVVYVAAEAPESVRLRIEGLKRFYGVNDLPVALVPCPIDLRDPKADRGRLVDLIRKIERESGSKVELVVIDTLASVMAGGNENTSEDMGAVIAGAKHVQLSLKTHVMLVHHSGKDQARGARGWSGLRAAIDNELEVEEGLVADGKQRDGKKNGPAVFRLETVPLGINDKGKPVETAVAVFGAGPAEKDFDPLHDLSEAEAATFDLIPSDPTGILNDDHRSAFVTEWRKRKGGSFKADSARKERNRAIPKLLNRKLIEVEQERGAIVRLKRCNLVINPEPLRDMDTPL